MKPLIWIPNGIIYDLTSPPVARLTLTPRNPRRIAINAASEPRTTAAAACSVDSP